MPVLNFKGKSAVYSHHLGAPFRPLEIDEKKSLPKKSQNGKKEKPSLDDNLIIHGDNLHALKALLPKYAGKVNCVYIDPPYNTGNESWKYNDNANSPMIKEWLGKAVGADDLERHDKWLCMMWPRLNLLKDLLSDDGVLICAIDHNEREHLGLILREIFQDKEIVCVTAVHNPRGIQGDNFSYTHEYAYFVFPDKKIIKKRYLEDEDISNFRNWGTESKREDAKNCFYPVIVKNNKIIGFGDVLAEEDHPKNQTVEKSDKSYEVWPIDKNGIERKWRYARQSAESIREMLKVKQTKNGKERFEIEIKKELGSYRTVWTDTKFDSSVYGTKFLRKVIPNCGFNFPKSFWTVKECLQAVCGDDKDSIILDSFAGSGTTAHAVLDLNKEDGGSRKFILVECEDYADKITAERVRRVIKGVPKAKEESLKKGLGGSFAYCALGKEISEENLIKGKSLPAYKSLSSYVYYTATGQTLDKAQESEDFYIGKSGKDTAFFVIYKPDIRFLRSRESALNLDRKEKIQKIMKQKNCKKAVVFASAHYFDSTAELAKEGILFCQLPWAIYRIAGA